MFLLGYSIIIACVTLAGNWSGSLECDSDYDDLEYEIEFDLEDGAEGYEGTGTKNLSFDVQDTGGNTYRLSMDFEFDVAVEDLKGSAEQELDVDAEVTDCEADLSPSIQGYDPTEYFCGDSEGDDATDGDWTLIGKDTISYESDDCEGEVER